MLGLELNKNTVKIFNEKLENTQSKTPLVEVYKDFLVSFRGARITPHNPLPSTTAHLVKTYFKTDT